MCARLSSFDTFTVETAYLHSMKFAVSCVAKSIQIFNWNVVIAMHIALPSIGLTLDWRCLWTIPFGLGFPSPERGREIFYFKLMSFLQIWVPRRVFIWQRNPMNFPFKITLAQVHGASVLRFIRKRGNETLIFMRSTNECIDDENSWMTRRKMGSRKVPACCSLVFLENRERNAFEQHNDRKLISFVSKRKDRNENSLMDFNLTIAGITITMKYSNRTKEPTNLAVARRLVAEWKHKFSAEKCSLESNEWWRTWKQRANICWMALVHPMWTIKSQIDCKSKSFRRIVVHVKMRVNRFDSIADWTALRPFGGLNMLLRSSSSKNDLN